MAFISTAMDSYDWRRAYALLTATVAPRPIAFVSTISKDGIENLAPFSFFIVGGANPPSLAFSPVLGKDLSEKDSLRNVRETNEFVVNIVHRSMAEGMNRASASLAPHESEWGPSGFTPLASHLVKPPRVAESRVQFECRLFTVVEHGSGPGAARYVIGEVLVVHIAEELYSNGELNPGAVEPIARLGGPGYVDIGQMNQFEMDRP